MLLIIISIISNLLFIIIVFINLLLFLGVLNYTINYIMTEMTLSFKSFVNSQLQPKPFCNTLYVDTKFRRIDEILTNRDSTLTDHANL